MSHTPRPRPATDDPGPVTPTDPSDCQHEARAQVGSPRPERTLPPGIEPMLGIDDLATLLSCSRRLVERMRSAGKVPKPDIKIGKMPRWKPETIRRWIEDGGRP